MPYDQTPQNSTYQTKSVKLMQEWDTRSVENTKDNDTVNCFFEIINNKQTADKDFNVVSRAGTEFYQSVPSSLKIRGMYYWEDFDKLYVAYDTQIAVITGSTGVVTATLNPLFALDQGDVGFTEFTKASGDSVLVVSDGTKLIEIDLADTITTCTDVNLPVPHDPHIIYLDGYLFLVKSYTADIYNSNLDDPMVWTPGDYITAEMLPDRMIRIARLANYLVAFGTTAIEYFWDVGNPSGSPLQRNDTPVKLVGYLGGLASWKNRLYFVGNTSTTNPTLFMLEDLKIETIASPPISRALVQSLGYLGVTISFSGHDFYALTSGSATYMMDLDSKLWTRIRFQQQEQFPIQFSVTIPVQGYGYASVCSINNVGGIGVFKDNLFLDYGVDFTPTIITDISMFDTYRRKFGHVLSIVGDRPTNNAYLSVSWTDDDYQTYSTPRDVPLNITYPVLTALGSFRRRAFKFVHHGNARMRVKNIEIDINMGSK